MAPRPRTSRTPKSARARKPPAWQAKFLAALADTDYVTEACRQARTARSTVYKHRDEDPVFAAAWAEIEEQSTEKLEHVAAKRATEGSDLLLIFLLKARRPDVYRDNHRVEHTGADGGPVRTEVAVTDKARSDAAREYLRAIAGD